MGALEVGTTIAGYRIEAVIGQGSMAPCIRRTTSRSTGASP